MLVFRRIVLRKTAYIAVASGKCGIQPSKSFSNRSQKPGNMPSNRVHSLRILAVGVGQALIPVLDLTKIIH